MIGHWKIIAALRVPKSQAIYERSENLFGTLLSGDLLPDALLLRSV